MDLNAQTRSVNDIFSPSKRYEVPRFQREFSWEEDQLDEFWDDIIQQITVKGKKAAFEEYFIGCIVLVGEDTKSEFQIVDGQQRLTTLTILLVCVINRLKKLGDKHAALALHSNVIEGKDNEGSAYFKLVSESPKPYFQNEIQAYEAVGHSKAATDEERRIKAAYERLTRKLESTTFPGLTPLETTKAIRDQVLDHLKFILVTAKNDDDAYTIFETLNARGLSLSSVDLIKNWIFKNYPDTHPNDNAKDSWESIRRDISRFAEIEDFFRHYWNSRYAYTSEVRLYKSFKDAVKEHRIRNAQSFLKELKEAAEVYCQIGRPNETDWPQQKERLVYRSLKSLNQYKVTQPRPFVLALLQLRKAKVIKQVSLLKTMSNLERFHFVFSNLCQERASGLESSYTRSARNLHNANGSVTAVAKVLKELNATLKKKMPPETSIATAVADLRYSKYGSDGHTRTIQTVFRKIEEQMIGTEELLLGNFSLEHIQDQSSGVSWTHEIGNLIPLDETLNNNMKTGMTFKAKKAVYSRSALKIVKHFLDLNPQDTWTESDARKWCFEIAGLLAASTQVKL